ncbi:MAG: hypothetical protein M1812_003905 [Candelaria pacifica]|nr:MAG: hypothetical protein M1812_003905 [Candelaria pacifica]
MISSSPRAVFKDILLGLCYVSVDKAGQPPDMETWDHIRTAVKWIIDTCVTADGIGGGKINVGDKDGLTVKVYAPNSPSYNQDLTAISLAAPQCSSSSTTVESSISSLLGCVNVQLNIAAKTRTVNRIAD